MPEAKPLSERVAYANLKNGKKSAPLTKDSANPKAQPKSATKAAAKDAAKGRKGTKNKARNQRPKPKTTEELDAEMTDYFNAGASAPATAGVAAPTNGDMGMEEISVRTSLELFDGPDLLVNSKQEITRCTPRRSSRRHPLNHTIIICIKILNNTQQD